MTPEEIEALSRQTDATGAFTPVAELPAEATPAQPPQATQPAQGAAPEAQPSAPEAAPADPSKPGLARRVVGDIATGVTEMPRAILKGARDAAQESMGFVVDSGNFVGSGIDKLAGGVTSALGLEPAKTKEIKAPTLPDLSAPTSVTGGLARNVSQFITGMVGLGKVAAPFKIANKAGKVAQEVGRAAVVGAVAFDPHGPRLANMVEGIPGASNFVTQYLAAQPGDTAAEGRLKNALESIGMDTALGSSIWVAAKLAKAARSADSKALSEALDEVNKLSVEEAKKLQLKSRPGGEAEPALDPGTDAGRPVPVDGSVAPLLPEGGSPGDALAPTPAAPKARDVLDLGSSPTQVEALDVVQSPSAAAAANAAPKKPRIMDMDDPDVEKVLKGVENDLAALEIHGSWEGALRAGHKFGDGKRVPWQKLMAYNHETGGIDNEPVLALMGRLADVQEARINAQRGGNIETGVRTDAVSTRMLNGMARLFNQEPGAFVGLLERIGSEAPRMQAAMEAGFLVTQKAMQDAYRLAARIRAGDLDEWGGDKDVALAAVKEVMQVAMTAYGHSASIMTNSARAVRRMRSDFAFTPEQLANIKSLDGEGLLAALENTGGSPAKLKQVMNPSLTDRPWDAVHWYYINNLLSGVNTHIVNLTTNAMMFVGRPLERVIGGKVQQHILKDPVGARTAEESMKQFGYLGGSLVDGWKAAYTAWKTGDSTLNPHNLEYNPSVSTTITQMGFKPWDSMANVLHNALILPALKTIGAPTRALGTVDELIKQGVYRSQIKAKAHIQAIREEGLTDPVAIRQFVEDKLLGSFDSKGRALDQSALQEARVATFQQDLLPGTFGKGAQSFKSEFQPLGFVVPFIKTPINVIRMGVKLTPGLNAFQKEYRQMLMGQLGSEQQAQAIGQMGMGSLFLGTAYLLAQSGNIVGAGPADNKKNRTWRDTGARPYSFIKRHDDGSTTFIPFNRFDPYALPFGLMADLAARINTAVDDGDDEADVTDMASRGGLAVMAAFVKQMSDKSFLRSVNQTIEALMEPDKSLERVTSSLVSNFVPMSGAMRYWNMDPVQREAVDVVDKMRATVPGLSKGLAAKRDLWGEPVENNRALWNTTGPSVANAEIRRLLEQTNASPTRPTPKINGVDLRKLTLEGGMNAFDAYQERIAQPFEGGPRLKESVEALIQTPEYQEAVDGDRKTRGSRVWMLYREIAKHRDAAREALRENPTFQKAAGLDGEGKPIPKPTKRVPKRTLGPAPAAAPAPAGGLGPVLDTFGQGQ